MSYKAFIKNSANIVIKTTSNHQTYIDAYDAALSFISDGKDLKIEVEFKNESWCKLVRKNGYKSNINLK